jgi:subfamily B ATP-binding cassette protein MsbA
MLDYLKKVLQLARPYRFRFALGLLCGFLSGALAFTLPASLTLAVDTVFPRTLAGASNASAASASRDRISTDGPAPPGVSQARGEVPANPPQKRFVSSLPAPIRVQIEKLVHWFRPSGRPSSVRLALVIALIPASMLVRSLLAYLNIYLLSWVGIRAAHDLRVRLFQHILNLPLGFFSWCSTGDLMVRFDGALAVNTTITGAMATLIREPISIFVLVVYLIGSQPLLSLFTLLLFPLCLVPIVAFGRKSRRSNSSIHGKYASLGKILHESFTGIRVIKGYNLESQMTEEFRNATRAVASFYMRMVRASELPGPLIEFFGSLGVAFVFVYFAFLSTDPAPAGNMFGFFFAVFGLYAPVKNLSRLHHQLAMARAGVEPVYQILAVKNFLPEPARPVALKPQNAAIRFEDVSFSYGDKPVLRNINLTIRPGQMVALVGRTGSGKTSIANLLLRFYDPQTGAVLIGDTDIRTVSSRDLRAGIAVVTQQTILFNDTIRRNIVLGREGAPNSDVEEAAKHAYAHDFIIDKPKGYETVVGEKGVNLSGGQQQRIAIARAILKNAPILILDEATSSLDTEAERVVQNALEVLMRGRTTICIAHRLSTIQNADLIVVLDAGRIVETGTHEELLQLRGLYRKLYELQFEPATASTL